MQHLLRGEQGLLLDCLTSSSASLDAALPQASVLFIRFDGFHKVQHETKIRAAGCCSSNQTKSPKELYEHNVTLSNKMEVVKFVSCEEVFQMTGLLDHKNSTFLPSKQIVVDSRCSISSLSYVAQCHNNSVNTSIIVLWCCNSGFKCKVTPTNQIQPQVGTVEGSFSLSSIPEYSAGAELCVLMSCLWSSASQETADGCSRSSKAVCDISPSAAVLLALFVCLFGFALLFDLAWEQNQKCVLLLWIKTLTSLFHKWVLGEGIKLPTGATRACVGYKSRRQQLPGALKNHIRQSEIQDSSC